MKKQRFGPTYLSYVGIWERLQIVKYYTHNADNGNIVYKDVIINWLDCKSTRPLVNKIHHGLSFHMEFLSLSNRQPYNIQ